MSGFQEYVGRATAAGSIAAVALLVSAVLDAGLWYVAFFLPSNTNVMLVYYLWLFAFVICAAVFLWWFFESYRLLGMLGSGRTKYRPLSATLLPLIPIVGLFFAYSLLRELWRRTETSNVSDEPPPGTPGSIKWAVFLSVAWYLFAASAGQHTTHFASRAEAAGYYLWPFALGFGVKLAGRRIISGVSRLQQHLFSVATQG
jgi:hypothetical protein